MPAADLGEGGRSILRAPVRVEGDAVVLAAAGGHGRLERVGDQRGALWSVIDQAVTRRGQMSMTVAGYGRAEPTATYVMPPHRLVLSMSAVKSRITRSGTGGAVLS